MLYVSVYFDDIHVADIACRDDATNEQALENAYFRTQNIDGSWSRGPRFEDGTVNNDFHSLTTVVADLPCYDGKIYGHRSSMMGDKFVIHSETEVLPFECDFCGFKEIV